MAEKKEAPPAVEDVADAPKPKKKKTLLIVILAVLLLGGGGAGWWFTMGKKPADPKAAAEASKHEAESKPPVYTRLDIFTVNLQKTESEDAYLQTEFQLKVADEKVAEAIKVRSPEIRNALLLLLSSKNKAELVTIEGKQKLSEQIVANTNKIIGAKDEKHGVEGVYFTTFVIQ
jgi:flagellar protein FliL